MPESWAITIDLSNNKSHSFVITGSSTNITNPITSIQCDNGSLACQNIDISSNWVNYSASDSIGGPFQNTSSFTSTNFLAYFITTYNFNSDSNTTDDSSYLYSIKDDGTLWLYNSAASGVYAASWNTSSVLNTVMTNAFTNGQPNGPSSSEAYATGIAAGNYQPITLRSIPNGSFSNNPTSNTCFVAGTPINTDQGIIHIELLNHDVNTIGGKPIVAITKITSTDSYLIQIPKDLLESNQPNQDTVISQLHKVLYKGVMTRAKDIPGVRSVPYNGQPLYNVLLESYSTMIVNNMVAETLHPRANVAVLYKHIVTNNLGIEEKNKLIGVFNKGIELTNDLRKGFFSNMIFLIMLDILLEPKAKCDVTPYSVLHAFLPHCCHVAEQTTG